MNTLLTLALLSTLSGGAEKNPLNQTTWNLTQMQISGQTVTPDAGLKATAVFGGGHIKGNLGCDGYGMDAMIVGQTIKRGALFSFAIDCGDLLNKQKRQFLNVLQYLHYYQQRGDTLTLFGKNNDSLTFQTAKTVALIRGSVPEGGPFITAPANQIGGNKLTDMTLPALVGYWKIVSLTAGSQTLKPGANASLSLEVTNGKLTLAGSAGCNRLSASGQASAGRLSFGPVMSTRMMCADMSAETALLHILAGPLTVSSDASGQMHWQGAAGEVVLQKQRAAATKPPATEPEVTKPEGTKPEGTSPADSEALEGKTFALQQINGEAPAIRGITIGFEKGQVSGSDGCNRYFGAYTTSGPLLSAPRLGSTLMVCPDQPDSPNIVKFMALGPMHKLQGNKLILSAGGETWVFVQVPGRK